MVTKNKLYEMRPPQYIQGLESLIEYINKHSNTKNMTMVEIGSYAGESTKIFSSHFKKVIAIDPFLNDYDKNDVTCQYMDLEKVYDRFVDNIKDCKNVTLIKKTSDDAIHELITEKFDFIYIDGLHTYEQVKKDIDNYLPLITYGNFLGGHDYHKNWQGVIDAITEKIGNPDKIFSDTSWIKKVK